MGLPRAKPARGECLTLPRSNWSFGGRRSFSTLEEEEEEEEEEEDKISEIYYPISYARISFGTVGPTSSCFPTL